MDTSAVFSFFHESVFMLIVFVVFFVFALSRGRQSVINLILGLYFALLISIEFPYLDTILSGASNPKTQSLLMIGIFLAFTIGATLLFKRLMPSEYKEKPHEALWKKILLAFAATSLVMAFSFHALPVTELITPGSPIQTLFSHAEYFFWWLLLPLVALYIAS